jgi:SAM-dependent methyltransferase
MDERVFTPPDRKGMRGHPTDLVIAWAVEREGASRLADMGCGNGRDAIQLIRVGLADFVFGVDNAQESSTHLDRIIGCDMVPSDVKYKFYPYIGDYSVVADVGAVGFFEKKVPDGIAELACWEHMKHGFDMAYSNNVIEHVDDPGHFIDVSLEAAPVAIHVAPYKKHGWFQANQEEDDKHKSSWNLAEFVDLASAHGEIVDYGKLLEVPGGGGHCLTPNCEHASMFVLVRRR